jgi:hypothetical protein
LMRLITQVTSLDTSSMLLKRFPRSGFFNFGNKSKSGVFLKRKHTLCRTFEMTPVYTEPISAPVDCLGVDRNHYST